VTARRVAPATARAIAAALPLACAAYGLVPTGNVLAGGAAWLVALAASLAGWGDLVARRVDAGADLGLRLAWGAAVIMAAAGPFAAAGALIAPVILALIAVGLAAHVRREATRTEPSLVLAARWVTGLGARPHVACFWLLAGGIAALNVLGALARLEGNVYDDDVIYTPLTRRLLEAGDMDEPYSFRRLSAYGGQTVLQALGAARGTLANLFLVDGGLFQLITLLLVIGLATRDDERTAPPSPSSSRELTLGLLVLVVLLLPSTAVNTASYWSGVVFFLALYRTAARAAATPAPAGHFAVAGMLAAAACTLRQSYLPVALLFLVAVLALRLVATPAARRDERRVWLASLAGGAIALGPYLVAAYRSNQTFLYPFWHGTANPSIVMRPSVPDPWHELQFFVEVVLEPDPIRVILPLAALLLVTVDRRRGRPLTALLIASAVGFVLLVHSFQLSVPQNLWRYAFGYATALVLALGAEVARSAPVAGPGVAVPPLGKVVLLAALVVQLAVSGRGLAKEYRDLGADLIAAASARGPAVGSPGARRLYVDLQAQVPAGAQLAVLLDEPYHLDHARNTIVNLDTPGFASARPGMPFFRGADAVADYLRGQGLRYLAFVRGDRSRYMYRRDFWRRRMFFDTELWRMQAAYAVDCIDNLAALATTHRVQFERDGIVLLDLEAR
jgi:hypothetical protein